MTRLQREGGTLAARAFGVVAGLASSALTARALGPEQRGAYFYVVTLATLIANAGNLGAPSANAFFAAKRPGSAPRLARWSFAIAVGIGVCGAGVFMLATHTQALQRYASPQGSWLFLLTPAVLGMALTGPLLAGLHRFHTLNLLQVAQQAVLIVAFALIAWRAPSPGAFLAASAVVAALGAISQALWAGRDRSARTEEVRIGEWMKYGLRAYAVLVLGAALTRLGVLFVRADTSAVELGHYSVAVQISDTLNVLPSSLAVVLFPTIVRRNTLSWAHCRREILRMLAAASGLALMTAILLRPAIVIVFGRAFAPAYVVSLCFIPGFLGYAATVIASQYLAAIGFPRVVTFNWMIACVTLVVASWALTPRWGAAGAALATSFSYGILAVLMTLAARRELTKART